MRFFSGIGADTIGLIWDYLVVVERIVDADAADLAGFSELLRWAGRAIQARKRRGG